ncbi:MAG: hypothetical protein C0407_01620, partial [Desulfobacca sp.]|nr:hypothetical protein [Desulfobacca sp.]
MQQFRTWKLDSFHPEIRISGWKHLDIRSVDALGRSIRSALPSFPKGFHSDALCRASEKAPVRVPYVDLKLRSPFGDRIKLSPETL